MSVKLDSIIQNNVTAFERNSAKGRQDKWMLEVEKAMLASGQGHPAAQPTPVLAVRPAGAQAVSALDSVSAVAETHRSLSPQMSVTPSRSESETSHRARGSEATASFDTASSVKKPAMLPSFRMNATRNAASESLPVIGVVERSFSVASQEGMGADVIESAVTNASAAVASVQANSGFAGLSGPAAAAKSETSGVTETQQLVENASAVADSQSSDARGSADLYPDGPEARANQGLPSNPTPASASITPNGPTELPVTTSHDGVHAWTQDPQLGSDHGLSIVQGSSAVQGSSVAAVLAGQSLESFGVSNLNGNAGNASMLASGANAITSSEGEHAVMQGRSTGTAVASEDGEPYGLRNVHVIEGDDGVQTWVRDAQLTPERGEAVAQAIATGFIQQGTAVASVTVNGRVYLTRMGTEADEPDADTAISDLPAIAERLIETSTVRGAA